uniref:Efflux transporter, outer membrane factor (OMF) lipoprotein, NodT family n=1 Tax=Candidatus Kentrum sp. DK TaxID=2126562 RepID=A0A450RYS7_9GAMM|nr:MAG: efflux transporter, outer membrane factor (OMF) lipoprotein, NodT family [Candidatus Kentron sp. DK]VFJ64410.1 MAG: efflux transporter, outer membrane factor (OMF) lipoprotein, NodT family [Candidatus Kentron sp. DK]
MALYAKLTLRSLTALKMASKCSFTLCKLRFLDHFCLVMKRNSSFAVASMDTAFPLISRGKTLLFGLGILAGCATATPPPKPPLPVTVPERWTAPVNQEDGSASGATAEDGAPAQVTDGRSAETHGTADDAGIVWIAGFHDPDLEVLVEEALGRNFDLRAAGARVEAARARAGQQKAQALPHVTAGLSATRAREGTSGTIANRFELEAQISWEADLWRRLDHATSAAVAESQATQADYRGARLALAANIARAWFDVIEAGQQLRLSDKSVANFEKSLQTIEQQYQLGIGSALDVRLARENLATARGERQTRALNRDTATRSLEILLGRYPAGAMVVPRGLPRLQRTVPVGLPSDLLRRRPDIIGADARLLAREHQLAVARANRLPSVNLTAGGGTASGELRNLMDWDRLAWTLVGGLIQPIWKGGELSAQARLAEADREQAWAEYISVVLRAFREVESTLTAEALLTGREAALRVAEEEATAAATLALDRYRHGLSDIVTLLSTQRREFAAKSALLAIVKQRLHTRIDLHLALGGGFSTGE